MKKTFALLLLALLLALAVLLPWHWFTSPIIAPGTFGDLQTDAATILRAQPDVVRIEVYPAQGKPLGRIVHIRDLHLNAGSAARLWLAGELAELLPLEDTATYQGAGHGGAHHLAAVVREAAPRWELLTVTLRAVQEAVGK